MHSHIRVLLKDSDQHLSLYGTVNEAAMPLLRAPMN